MLQHLSVKLFRCIHIIHINPPIRCFTSVCNSTNASITTATEPKHLFASILGIKEEDAQEYISKHNINHLETTRLKDALQFFKKRKYSAREVLKNPNLFKQCANKTWEHYYLYFKECGCVDVPLKNLIKRIRFTPIQTLRNTGIIPADTSVVDNLQKQLDIPLKEEDIKDLRNDNLTLSYVHRTVIHRYLVLRLGASMEDLETIARIHTQIYNKSLKRLCENLNIALDLGYTPKKILRNPYILQVNPENTKEILRTMPNFANCDMRQQLRLYPKLIGLSSQHIKSIYDILKASSIPDETIIKTMNIFTLSKKTVQERLEDIKSTPETRVLMNNSNILKLIVHYHRAQSRLQFLHKVRLKCASLLVIGFDGQLFDNYIKEGKDVNKRKETDGFVRSLLDCTQSDVEINFKKHPYYLYVPFIEIESTYRYLRRLRFENAHIIKCISILLYPQEKITEVLSRIKEDHYISVHKPRVNKMQILNLALYYLEKEHHFTGNGIWRVNKDYAP